MKLQDYTTEELRAELKRRTDLVKAEKAKVKRCRMCKHWGAITYFGKPANYTIGNSHPCRFFKTKNGIETDKILMIGDASGKEGQFSDSDKKCAKNAGYDYMDVNDFINDLL